MLKYNKNYATLAFNYALKNLKGTSSVSEINRRYRNNNIGEWLEHIKSLRELL